MQFKSPDFSKAFSAHSEAEAMIEYAKRTWNETVDEFYNIGALELDMPTRLKTIERYCQHHTEYQFNYSTYKKNGPVFTSENGHEYVNMGWAMISKLDEKLLKFEDTFIKWTKGLEVKKEALKEPTAADEYLARAQGMSTEEYRRKEGIKVH